MFEKIFAFTTSLSMLIGGLFYSPETAVSPEKVISPQEVEKTVTESESFGAFSPAAGGTYRLQSSIGTTDTTIKLSSFTEPITGTPLTMSSLATDIAYATLDPQSSTRKEFISFTGITQNADGTATLSGVSRGLGFISPFTASSTLRKSHPGQSIFILSDSPQFYNEYARRRSNETITGQWTFDTFPITASSSFGSATTSGWVELATGGEAASSTLTGDISQSKLALHTGISTSSCPSSGNVVVVTGDDGNINNNCLPTTITNATTFTSTTTGMGRFDFYTASSTWNNPTGAKIVEVCMAAGGGGGGSGGSDNTASVYGSGGGGGGGGGFSCKTFRASSLSSTVAVTVGAGGAGGSGVAAISAGNAGSAGSDSSFGSYLVAKGGGGGGGGPANDHTTGGAAGSGGAGTTETGGAGGAGTGANGAAITGFAPTGGGGGGGNITGVNGGAGGSRTVITHNGSAGGSGDTEDSGDIGTVYITKEAIGGVGGGGGEGTNTSDSGNGGAGGNGIYGSGGGGGGSSYSGTSGAGGRGGDGFVMVITY